MRGFPPSNPYVNLACGDTPSNKNSKNMKEKTMFKVRYLGTSRYGMHKYAIVPTITPAIPEQRDAQGNITQAAVPASDNIEELIQAARDAGIGLNQHVNPEHEWLGFMTGGQNYKIPNIGDQGEFAVEGFVKEGSTRRITFFSDLDRQEVKKAGLRTRMVDLVTEVTIGEKALTDAKVSLGFMDLDKLIRDRAESNAKIKLLNKQLEKLSTE